MITSITRRWPENVVIRDYVLFITAIDGEGAKIRLYWDRSSRMWISSEVNATGYASSGTAQAQLTRIERQGWRLPKGWTRFEWGYELRERRIA